MTSAEGAGDFAPGADAEDVLLPLGFLWRIASDAEGAARAERLIDLVVRGLSARPYLDEIVTPDAARKG